MPCPSTAPGKDPWKRIRDAVTVPRILPMSSYIIHTITSPHGNPPPRSIPIHSKFSVPRGFQHIPSSTPPSSNPPLPTTNTNNPPAPCNPLQVANILHPSNTRPHLQVE
ncbi:hypothetical protein IAQ61_005094 [Plenodomus lingam]|uniref:uncharacterized protein n=1 Tax=Leptosphaeria maculans TaxID=5022 RepID=UPI00331DFD59|nr:hypothetical protein IAQ61_005094 [Plenodomus lingam]